MIYFTSNLFISSKQHSGTSTLEGNARNTVHLVNTLTFTKPIFNKVPFKLLLLLTEFSKIFKISCTMFSEKLTTLLYGFADDFGISKPS